MLSNNTDYRHSLNWGTDSTLILWEYSEWTSNYYFFDMGTSEIEYIDTTLEGYFLPDYIKWIDENKLLFYTRAHIKKDGTAGEYTLGYRQDMAIYNTKTKDFAKITDADDGEYYSFIGNKDNNLYLKRIILDDMEKLDYFKLDLDTGEIHKLNENNEIIAILDEENYIIIDHLEDQEGFTMYHINGQDKYEIATWYKEYWPSYVKAYLFPNKLYLLYNSDILYYSIDN